MTYSEVLKKMNLTEKVLTEQEFDQLKEYAVRKAKLNSKPEWYVDLLLPEVIKENLLSQYTLERWLIKKECRRA